MDEDNFFGPLMPPKKGDDDYGVQFKRAEEGENKNSSGSQLETNHQPP